MQHVIRLTDLASNHMVLLTVSELEASQPAIDVVFDLIGAEDLSKLVSAEILPFGQVDDLKALQEIVFGHDQEGSFIKDGVTFTANGVDLDPDKPLIASFTESGNQGQPTKICNLVLSSPELQAQLRAAQKSVQPVGVAAGRTSASTAPGKSPSASTEAPSATNEEDLMNEFAMMMFLQQIGIGFQIDVTKEFPEIGLEIASAEKKNWIEIDVTKAAYKLTEDGKAALKKYIDAAQDLIKRYDIYCDVDVDSSGTARFDTGLGQDLRIAAYEFEGIDPFKARFLLGLNDGEWNNLSNWMELIHDKAWYDGVFEPVEMAPSIDDVGTAKMQSIMEQGKAALREEQSSSRY